MTRPTANTGKRLLRLKDAASYLSLSPGSLRRLIQSGELPCIVLGGDGGHSPWLVDVRDLDGWVEKSKRVL